MFASGRLWRQGWEARCMPCPAPSLLPRQPHKSPDPGGDVPSCRAPRSFCGSQVPLRSTQVPLGHPTQLQQPHAMPTSGHQLPVSAGTPGTPWGLQGGCTNTRCPLPPAETASCLRLPPMLPQPARCPRAPGTFCVPFGGAGRAQQHPDSSARPPGAAGAPRATAGPHWHPAARPGGCGSAQLPATSGKAVRDGDGASPRAAGKPQGRGEAASWGFAHGRSWGRSRSSSRWHAVPRDSREPSPERRVEPSAPPWPGPGLLEPGGERGGTGRASGSGTCPIGLWA